jgi:hypothetical protein
MAETHGFTSDNHTEIDDRLPGDITRLGAIQT